MAQGCRTHQKNFASALFLIFLVALLSWVVPKHLEAATTSARQTFVTVKSGDTLYSIFKKQGIPPKTLAVILHNPTAAQPLKQLHIGQHIRFTMDKKNSLESLAVTLNHAKTLVVFRGGSRFIARIETASFRVPKTVETKKVAPVAPKPIIKPSTPQPPAKAPLKKSIVKTKSTPTVATTKKTTNNKPIQKATPETKPSIKTPLNKTNNTKPLQKPPVKITAKPNTVPGAQKAKPASPKKPVVQAKPKAPSYPPLHYVGMTIHSSLYNDGKKAGIPYNILNQLTKIFALRINFKEVKPGDKLVLAYDDAHAAFGFKIVPGNIIAVKFTQGKRVYSAVRYVNAQGVAEYFSPDGESMKKAFTRFPVKYTHINSLFNMHRMHPVTHVIRPHTGVDLAAPLGTPIYSIGDGKISFIGWEGAYGNIVKVQHNEKYSSMYAHMLRFAPGLSVGSYVKRGQLIGFLGQTGNATGPHVHFEIRVYNVPVNPLTVPLPYSSSVPASQINAFRAKSKILMNALDYYQKTHLQ